MTTADWIRDGVFLVGMLFTAFAVFYGNGRLDKQVKTIHNLVNSNMTAVLQSELGAVTRELAMMHEVIALKRAAGQEPDIETIATVKTTETKVVVLKTILADRNGN